MELTILMPCLDEAETLEGCVRQAREFLERAGVVGEVLVADNGSTDGSIEIAIAAGARVTHVVERGYGAALLTGTRDARGCYVIVGDADGSYDFSRLEPFLAALREGADLVMGNRFEGGIAPGAMPFLHRYLGNPMLSFLGRLFFHVDIGDFHCGLRGYRRASIEALGLKTTGMEHASEMVVRAALAGCRIVEIPTTLRPDGRSRPPYLRTWSDGWRHLRFLLLFSPRWLLLYPGIALFVSGALGAAALFRRAVYIAGVGFDLHAYLVLIFASLVGLQLIMFAIVVRRFAARHGILPPLTHYAPLLGFLTSERMLPIAALVIAAGIGGVAWSVGYWAERGFGPLEYASLVRGLSLSLAGIAAGVQIAIGAFLGGVIEIAVRR